MLKPHIFISILTLVSLSTFSIFFLDTSEKRNEPIMAKVENETEVPFFAIQMEGPEKEFVNLGNCGYMDF